MSKFAKGVNVGTNVRQGQTIGYVGSTGYSTGPHLHYEMHYGGVRVDPLGSYVSPILDTKSASSAATMTQGTNYLGRPYCFRPKISSIRLKPYVGNSKSLKEKFPGCTGWCN
jgi:murein DD-endopeptidase MepM/ murein hydrolase activator NlpD